MSNIKEKFITILETNKLVSSGDRVILAISGGVDSRVLLDLFAGIAKQKNLELFVAHVNHSMRKSAARDEKFVRALAGRYGFSYFTAKLTPASRNIEETLREKRYQFLNKLAEELSANVIATAHQRDDNIETGLMNLMRGTSFRGLSGIRLRAGRLIRPLLPVSREEILAYAKNKKLKWVEDETNTNTKFFRNRVRHLVLPYLTQEAGSEFKENFFRLMMLSREANDFIVAQSLTALSNIEFADGTLDLKEFKKLPNLVQKEVLKLKVEQVSGDLKSVGAVHLEAAVRAMNTEQSPKTVEFPRGLKIKKHSAKVSFEFTDGKRRKK